MFARPEPSTRPKWLHAVPGGARRPSVGEIAELEFYWGFFESRILRSPGLEYTSRSVGGSYDHPLAEQNIIIAMGRASKIFARLKRLSGLHLAVLFQVYGGQRRKTGLLAFGDVANIVGWTPEAKRLAARKGVPVDEALAEGLRGPEAAVFVASMRNAGERLLCAAAESYRQAKRGEPCTSPRS